MSARKRVITALYPQRIFIHIYVFNHILCKLKFQPRKNQLSCCIGKLVSFNSKRFDESCKITNIY